MKKLILVALILQLVITLTATYKFGDIIKFPRKCARNNAKPLINHYAIYVGKQSEVDVGQGENDIVHRTRDKPSCQFAKLAIVRGRYAEKEFNYLDGIKKKDNDNEVFTAGTTDEIKARITDMVKNCPDYNLLCNNCEHFATKVRYNIPVTMQVGAVSQYFVVLRKEAKALLERIQNEMTDENKCERFS